MVFVSSWTNSMINIKAAIFPVYISHASTQGMDTAVYLADKIQGQG